MLKLRKVWRSEDREERLEDPKRLFASEVRVPAPSPESACAESTLHVLLRPLDARSRPLVFVVHSRVLMSLVRELLVVGGELNCKCKQREEG